MPNRSQDRRADRATADEVAEVERQLWEFAKRIDPPGVPEAKLRPGAFLYRIHRTWHSLGRGTGGLASRSFRALRDELLTRDPPVRNLQPKLYGNTALSLSDAEHLIDVVLETWHLEKGRNGKWQTKRLPQPESKQAARAQDAEAIRENLVHTLFRGEDALLLEETIGVPPELFMQERGRSSLALIIPTIGETIAHLSPSNAYGGFSNIVGRFFNAAFERRLEEKTLPLLIWIIKLGVIRDNPDFHQDFHCLAIYSSSLTNWYFRLSRTRGDSRKEAEIYWNLMMKHSAFVIHGLPVWYKNQPLENNAETVIDENLADLTPNFFVPPRLPITLANHRFVRRHRDRDFVLNVSIEQNLEAEETKRTRLRYWLFPDQPNEDLEETAETTGMPVFDAEISPGEDYDLAFSAAYEAVAYRLGFSRGSRAQISYETLASMGWRILTVNEFQKGLIAGDNLEFS